MTRLNELFKELLKIENELLEELQKNKDKYYYEIIKKKVLFQKNVRIKNRKLAKGIIRYLLDVKPVYFLTAPLIISLFIPAVILDISVTLYQSICFPVYKIPRVKRSEYILIDRQYLDYLNILEKFNCVYCGYFNGLMGYVSEVASRTEQHFCPIKHAHKLKTMHSRYEKFIDYGDAEKYRKKLKEVRNNFRDIKKE